MTLRRKNLLLSILLLTPILLAGNGIDINYSDYTFFDVKVGAESQLNPSPILYNGKDSAATYSLTPVSLEYKDGYRPLPELSWLTLPEKVVIEPDKSAAIDIYLDIPRQNSYFNQRWLFGIEVRRKLCNNKSIQLGGIIILKVETIANANTRATELYPSSVEIDDGSASFTFWLENTEQDIGNYKIFLDEELDKNVQRKLLHNRFFKNDWVQLAINRLTLNPGERRKVEGTIVRKEDKFETKFEKLIWVEDDKGQRTFVRLLFD